jgi:hypothetical protein
MLPESRMPRASLFTEPDAMGSLPAEQSTYPPGVGTLPERESCGLMGVVGVSTAADGAAADAVAANNAPVTAVIAPAARKARRPRVRGDFNMVVCLSSLS